MRYRPRANRPLGRGFDLAMKEIQNAKERDAEDWRKLFESADPCFAFCGVKQPSHSTLAIIEAVWECNIFRLGD